MLCLSYSIIFLHFLQPNYSFPRAGHHHPSKCYQSQLLLIFLAKVPFLITGSHSTHPLPITITHNTHSTHSSTSRTSVTHIPSLQSSLRHPLHIFTSISTLTQHSLSHFPPCTLHAHDASFLNTHSHAPSLRPSVPPIVRLH